MSVILESFRERREILRGITVRDNHERIVALLDWMDLDPQIRPMLDDLRQTVDAASLLHDGPSRRPPKPKTPEEVRAFGLFLMEQCRNSRTGLYTFCHKFHIAPRFRSGNANDYIDAAMAGFIVPFLDYVEERLAIRDIFSPASLVDSVTARLYRPQFRGRFPETAESIERISLMCNDADRHESWFAVSTMCRELLLTFAKEFRVNHQVAVSTEVKEGDVKAVLRACISAHCEPGRYADTLTSLLVTVWDHTQCLLHRKLTTKEELLRLILFVNLTISEIAYLP